MNFRRIGSRSGIFRKLDPDPVFLEEGFYQETKKDKEPTNIPGSNQKISLFSPYICLEKRILDDTNLNGISFFNCSHLIVYRHGKNEGGQIIPILYLLLPLYRSSHDMMVLRY